MDKTIIVGIAFGVAFVSSLLWTYYIHAINTKSPTKAALFDSGLIALGGIVTMIYVLEGWLVFTPTVVGTFLGTFLSLRWVK
jgi:hypothetical protein